MPRFVQFPHPAPEAEPDNRNFILWNTTENHRRKFMQANGSWLEGENVKGGVMWLWGEWEPESEVVCRIARPKPHYPRYLYRPFYVVPICYKDLQNTDPFVFDGFFYGNCRQRRQGKRTRLCYLEPGSVVLFGSCRARKIVLDTVFVVRDWIDYDCASYGSVLKDRVPRGYVEIVLNPLCQSGCTHKPGCAPGKGEPFRLYRGVTYADRRHFDGMFSFFPCRPRDERCEGFRRPIISGLHGIPDKPPVAYRLNLQKDLRNVQHLWECVVNKVLEKGLWLGIEAEMPERRGAKR